MQAVETAGVSRISAFTNLNDVLSILWRDDGREAVAPDQGRVVADTQLEPLGVHDRHVGIELADPQPQPLDLDRDPVTFLGCDDKVIDVFVVGDAVDRHVHRDRLGGREVIVGLGLVDFFQGAHAERSQLADPGRRPDPDVMQSQDTVRSDLDFGPNTIVVELLETDGGDACLVVDDFLGIAQTRAGERDFELGPALAADRPDRAQRGRGRMGAGLNREEQGKGESASTHGKVSSPRVGDSRRYAPARGIDPVG